GCTVDVAEDGERAVEVALTRHPDVAFVDIGLPTIDGYEVARRVRSAGDNTYLDAPGATYPHKDAQGRCSFEALVTEHCARVTPRSWRSHPSCAAPTSG